MTNKKDDKEIKALLKSVIAPLKDTEPRHDLWPQMLRSLQEQLAPVDHVPWFDWALAAIFSALLIIFPGAIPALLYHL